jgi:hypothetical protein
MAYFKNMRLDENKDKLRIISELIKQEYKKQSFKRKLRNIYLGYKYRLEDFLYDGA